jgi:hypothetical protein
MTRRFTHPREQCPLCGELAAENWWIRHMRTHRDEPEPPSPEPDPQPALPEQFRAIRLALLDHELSRTRELVDKLEQQLLPA